MALPPTVLQKAVKANFPFNSTFASSPMSSSIKRRYNHTKVDITLYFFNWSKSVKIKVISSVYLAVSSSLLTRLHIVRLFIALLMAEVSQVPSDPASSDSGLKMNADPRSQLRNLTAQATLKYSVKDYNAAAELYSHATELQAEINGELSSENADLLYAYGRCLYHVAVKNSDVLGSKVAGERREHGQKKPGSKKQNRQGTIEEADGQQRRFGEEVVTKIFEENDGPMQPHEEAKGGSKPYFQFTGDENFDTSDEEDEEGAEVDAEDAEEADEEDDLANAYEVLDLARVLLLKKLEEAENSSGRGKEKGESQQVQQLKERLADTYDLQAEISLEGERFHNAVVDLKSALELKKGLFPQESSFLAEAHFKLSLALEFTSITRQYTENGEVDSDTDAHVDESMREEAALEMEEAITSCRLRITKEEAILLDPPEAKRDPGKPKVAKDIADVQEMVKEMEQRVSYRVQIDKRLHTHTLLQLVELRQPPISVNDPTSTGTIDGSNPLSGILGSILGESPAAQKARLEEASKDAKDLTNLIKRKKPAEDKVSKASEPSGVQSNGKRKVDIRDKVEEVVSGKKAKISDGAEE